ncbi:serine/threonine protein kinase [Calothrix rhizosoleniae]|uniref:serine/threonine protein kinase n=1 Tax=Calothrix rhizosoleniae TaxID=888997 RepID=UPI000B4A0152|nr:serine/threonine-protein kinase [Calothrix rhizosoleniae]
MSDHLFNNTSITLNNNYLILNQLGVNGGRYTLLAKDLHTEKRVVIKTLIFSEEFRWEDLKLFEREAETLKNLSHSAIPKYIDYFEFDTQNIKGFALVQNYIDAPSLETVICNGRKFSEVEVIEVAECFLEILIYLHEQIPPIIHRDIKPSNILLTNRSGNSIGDIYLVDFGSVQTVSNKGSGTVTIVGSYGYMPFEQFSGQTTMASDLYSFGMTLIYLITGVHPAELPQVDGRVEFKRTDISNKLVRWLEKMTHPYLERRFDSAKSALTALKSEDGSHGDYSHLKPAGSEVQLYRDQNKLGILFVKENISKARINIGFINSILFIFCVICFQGFGIFVGILLVMLNSIMLESINEDINSYSLESIFYHYKIFYNDGKTTISIGTSKKSQPIEWQSSSCYQNIDLLAYQASSTFDSYVDGKGILINVPNAIPAKPKLSIYAGSVEYQVGDGQLSEGELLWLGKELSDFLGLEMQVIYPTPKLPPEF